MPATKSAHGGSQSNAPATKPAHRGSQSAAPATNSAHGGSQSAVPATKYAHGGSQSAVPATKSALQETTETSNHNGRTIPSMTRDRLATVVPRSFPVDVRRSMEVHKVLRLPRNLHMEVHKVMRLPRNLHTEVRKLLCLPRTLHIEVHKVLCLPRTETVLQPSFRGASPSRFGEAWRFTNCACHEICTSRFTQRCACHELCACHEICAWRVYYERCMMSGV